VGSGQISKMPGAILVTGITGELGTAMAERLAESKRQAFFIIRRPQSSRKSGLNSSNILNIDIRDREGLFKHADKLKGRIDTIVHMASLRDGARNKDLFDTIFSGTLNLYELAGEIRCPRFINFSSILAAGWVPKGMGCLDENYIPDISKLCNYGRMKLKTEMKLEELSGNFPTKVITLRPGNVYGPPKLSFIRFITGMIRRRDKIFYQRAKRAVMWAPIHTQDVLDCVFMLIEKECFENGRYFLTGDESPNFEELTDMVSNLLGSSGALAQELNAAEKLQLAVRKLPDYLREITGRPSFPDFVYSNQKIKEELGFYPKIKLKEGITGTLAWAGQKEVL